MAIIIDEVKSKEKSLYDILIAQAKGRSPKKKSEEDDDLGDEEAPPKKSGKSSKEEDDDDDDDVEDDNWNKDEAEDEEWDPDFEEFDLPKSKGKKAVGGAKKGAEEEEDFKVDDEFKDLFNDGASLDEDEEDDF
jgi:DNA-directed RNA polymerase subunit delta